MLHNILIVFDINREYVGWNFCAHTSLGNGELKLNTFSSRYFQNF